MGLKVGDRMIYIGQPEENYSANIHYGATVTIVSIYPNGDADVDYRKPHRLYKQGIKQTSLIPLNITDLEKILYNVRD